MIKNYLSASIERGGLILVKLLSLVLLARFISPLEFGVFAMASVVISISLILVDSGLGGALIKEQSPSDKDYSTVFTINIILSAILCVCIGIGGFGLASLYDEPSLSSIIAVLLLTLPLRALSLIHVVRLTRKSQFFKQSIVGVLGALFGLLVAFVMALNEYGIWALVWQQVAEAIFISTGLWLCERGYPQLGISKESYKRLWSFGFHLTLASMVRWVYDSVIILIIGKVYSVAELGHFTQANRVNNIYSSFLTGVIDKVAFAKLAYQFNISISVFKSKCLTLYFGATFIGFFLVSFSSAKSVQLIDLLLGKGWGGASDILSIISLCGAGVIIETVARICMKSAGLSRKLLQAEILKRVFGLIVLIGAFRWGLDIFLYALLFVSAQFAGINILHVNRYLGISVSKQCMACMPAAVSAFVLWLYLIQGDRQSAYPLIDLLYSGFFGGLIYCAVFIVGYAALFRPVMRRDDA